MHRWKRTDGFCLEDFCNQISMSVDTTLTEDQKRMFISFDCSAASKSLVLGVDDGEVILVANIGDTNAVTVKGITGDTGTSVGAGKTAMVIGSTTADTTKIYVLN